MSAYKKNDIHETILAAGCEAIGETSDAVVYLTLFGKNHKEITSNCLKVVFALF